jgi:plastocyanin
MSRRNLVILTLGVAVIGASLLLIGKGAGWGRTEAPAQVIVLEAKAIKFNGGNPTLEVRRGVPVEITIRNQETGMIPHDFAVVGLALRTPKPLQPGEASTLRFTPSRPGDYGYVCTLHPGLMDGRLVVRP